MKDTGIRDEFFKCQCHSEGMMVTQFTGEEEVYFSYWREGKKPRPMGLFDRFKWAFKIIFKGEIFEDEVILDREEVRRLAKTLQEMSK